MKFKTKQMNTHENFHPTDHHPAHIHMHPAPHPPAHPIHHGVASSIIFDEGDYTVLSDIFGDMDTATAVCQIMMQAPPEVKLMFYFQLRLWNELHASETSAEEEAS